MSEYWKSNPRKFCDFCKCWIADNRPSVDFHERGKRHKENVQIRLAEMAKKGKEDYEAQQQEGDFLKAMEEAALKAYKDDIQHNPDMTGTKISEIASAKNAEIVVNTKKAPEEEKPKEDTTVKKWYEAKSPEGYCYYWNIETGASKWDEPEEGFLSLAEQDKIKKKDKQENNSAEESEKDVKDKKKDKREKSSAEESGKIVKDKKIKDKHENKSAEESGKIVKDKMKDKHENKSAEESGKIAKDKKSAIISAPTIVFGPLKKAEAYSSWKEVKNEAEETTDYQLPQLVEEEYYGPEISFKRPEVTFKEKTVTLSSSDKGGGGEVSFKKRKSAQDHKKSVRQRTNDL